MIFIYFHDCQVMNLLQISLVKIKHLKYHHEVFVLYKYLQIKYFVKILNTVQLLKVLTDDVKVKSAIYEFSFYNCLYIFIAKESLKLEPSQCCDGKMPSKSGPPGLRIVGVQLLLASLQHCSHQVHQLADSGKAVNQQKICNYAPDLDSYLDHCTLCVLNPSLELISIV